MKRKCGNRAPFKRKGSYVRPTGGEGLRIYSCVRLQLRRKIQRGTKEGEQAAARENGARIDNSMGKVDDGLSIRLRTPNKMKNR